VPAPAPVPSAPEIVEISIVSTPAGASVYRVGETVALGVTPFSVSLPRSDTPTQMRFERTGYATKTIEVPIAESLEIAVNLVREATPDDARAVHLKTKPSSGQQPVEKPKKLQREGVIDPFAK
jgi:hypothetical protein